MLEYSIGQGYSALDAQAWRDKLDGFAVASGLGVSVDSGLDLTVAAGTATVGETSGSVDTVTLGSSTTVNVGPADSTDPRKDTIYIDTSGTVQVESGTPEPADPSGNTQFQTYQPEPPSPSTDGAILAEVWVGAGETTLQSGDVRDRRAPAGVVADRAVVESIPNVYDGTNVVADVDNDSVSTDELDVTPVTQGSVTLSADSSQMIYESPDLTSGFWTVLLRGTSSGTFGRVEWNLNLTGSGDPQILLTEIGGSNAEVGYAVVKLS